MRGDVRIFMNRTVATVLLLIFFGLFISGEIARLAGWAWPELLSTMAPILCVASIAIVANARKDKISRTIIKLGSETLPPIADIAYVTVDGIPISDAKKNMLLKAMARAKRASACGKILQEIPFQLQDHWGGVWDFVAYQDDQANRGFSINGVYYSGSRATLVAECVGLRR
jgi:hypothetical protein